MDSYRWNSKKKYMYTFFRTTFWLLGEQLTAMADIEPVTWKA